jgi:hypothetical protein
VRQAGRKWPNSRTTGRIISESAAERDTGIDHRVVSRWRKGLADVDAYRLRMYGAAYRSALGMFRRFTFRVSPLKGGCETQRDTFRPAFRKRFMKRK